MDNAWEFFWTVVASSAGTTVLLGAAAWLCRAQISHWINKDLEAVKAKYQRDLEDYRTSLIAAAEQIKAKQALKTAGALKIIERKFQTLEALARVLRDHASKTNAAVSLAQLTQDRRLQEIQDTQRRIDDVNVKIEDAASFLTSDEYVQLLRFNQSVMALIGPVMDAQYQRAVPPSEETKAALFAAQAQANALLKEKIVSMMEMA